ncbi:MalY/PatB family protein [Metabacillus malikii]|uniref:cysteine-S-conjugate beta-lyase n=1 Tax=Metabacillus malikii TaxID=1504265 RepID=A0ABT9ZC02_9BACI|nr:MalY/PatB family protein [Metabacillus malikii]MDQ0229797.1 cystathionine beta-lyase [Metabacillus malikii]
MNQFDEMINRKDSSSAKWSTKKIFGDEEVLPMWVADMDFRAPDKVIEAIHQCADHGVFGYSMPMEETEKAIQSWLKQRHNWEISDNIITYSPGIVTAISMAIQTFTGADDKIVVQPPVYYPFFEMAKKHKREVLYNALKLNENHRYEIDFADFEKKVADPKTKMFILCNPHNPSGRIWSRDELTKMAELCLKHDVLIISDDIHSDLLLFGNEYTPLASISEEIANNTITCIAPSKTFNLAGLQASAVLIPNATLKRKYTQTLQLHGLMGLNTFGMVSMEAAYKHGSEWLDQLINYLEDNVKEVEKVVQEKLPHFKVMRPESTYLVWIDARKEQKTDEEMKELLLKKGKLALEPGSKFGENGAGFLRMNIACPRETLRDGLNRLVQAFS